MIGFRCSECGAPLTIGNEFPGKNVPCPQCGTPVIASRVGGLRHTVNERVGSFIEPGDDKALAKKVIAFITQGFKQKAGEEIAAYARENFSWNNTVKNIEKIYVQVLEKDR